MTYSTRPRRDIRRPNDGDQGTMVQGGPGISAIAPASSGVSFGSSVSLTAPTSITPASGSVTFTGSGGITSIPIISGSGSVTFSGSGSITAPIIITHEHITIVRRTWSGR